MQSHRAPAYYRKSRSWSQSPPAPRLRILWDLAGGRRRSQASPAPIGFVFEAGDRPRWVRFAAGPGVVAAVGFVSTDELGGRMVRGPAHRDPPGTLKVRPRCAGPRTPSAACKLLETLIFRAKERGRIGFVRRRP